MPAIGIEPYVSGPGDSLPGYFTLPGSGLAVPAGLEAVLEFNGLFMNVRQNPDRYRVNSIDGLFDADVRDTRDVNTADDGETPANAFYGGRTIVINGTIDTYSVSKLRDMQQAFRAAFADISVERPLHFRVGDFTKDHFINCKKISALTGTEAQQNYRAQRDFQVSLRASDPRFLSYYQQSVSVTPNPALFPIMNQGNYWARPVVKVYGPSTSTTILNDTLGQSITILAVPSGDYFIFDTAKKTLRNSANANQWNNLSDDSVYMKLQGISGANTTGTNLIRVTGDSPRVDIAWYHSWM